MTRRRCRTELLLAFLAGAALALGPLTAARAQEAAGTADDGTIKGLIDAARADGQSIIYSSGLVDESAPVRRPGAAGSALDRLAAALADLGLALTPGPQGSWLIVRAADTGSEAGNGGDARASAFRPIPPSLELVVVSASRYAFSRSTAPSVHQVDRQQLEYAPTFGDDALRTTHALPGLTSSGLTAKVNVRGGEADESLLLLDGVELHNPFHLKDFQSLFGSISPRIVDFIDVRTGGFPAEYGGRMSAVIDIRTITPTEPRHFEVGMSTLSSSVLSSGRFADDRGSWLTSIRRGNLDLLLNATNADVGRPLYVDFFSKLTYALSETTELTAGMHSLADKISLADGDRGSAGANYDDAYFWVRLDRHAGESFDASYQLVFTQLDSDREGTLTEPNVVTGSLDDRRNFQSAEFKADWRRAFDDRQLLRWGLSLADNDAEYVFALTRQLPYPISTPGLPQPGDQRDLREALSQRRQSLYASYRVQLLDRLVAELGLRYAHQTWLDEQQTSPRLSLLFDVSDRTSLRASWGRFYQPQGLDELQVGDGLTAPYPAQEAEHEVLSLEHLLTPRFSFRVELYRKHFERLRPRFENLFTRVSLIPELLPDRAMISPSEGEAEGIEFSFAGMRDSWQWWLNASRANVRDEIASGRVRRSWEERWSVKGGFIWTGPVWNASLQTTTHMGWPITTPRLDGTTLTIGGYNADKLEEFRSIDLRGARSYTLERGTIELFMEFQNVLNHDNPCCYEYELQTDAAGVPQTLLIDGNRWLPAIPSVGFLWQF